MLNKLYTVTTACDRDSLSGYKIHILNSLSWHENVFNPLAFIIQFVSLWWLGGFWWVLVGWSFLLT